MPAVFLAPIRNDVVQFVHTNIAKNARQAYGVSRRAGHQVCAESWGTGRAVARIPRVSGGGTSRSGQGAYGNQCRGGRMFNPTKVFRRWHRHVNKNQRRYAVASALAASSVPALVCARGHRIDEVAEIPLVVDDSITKIDKTKDAKKFLQSIHALCDVEKAGTSRHVRPGKGKWRNRRYLSRKGPLIVFADKSGQRAFRNLQGVDTANVHFLNLLQLAPGGHIGRFIIWTKAAFDKLDSIYGTFTQAAQAKSGYTLPHSMITTTDLARVVNSAEVQKACRAKRPAFRIRRVCNPLRAKRLMAKFNPAAALQLANSRTAAAARARVKKHQLRRREAELKRRREQTSKKPKPPAKVAAKKAPAKPAAKQGKAGK